MPTQHLPVMAAEVLEWLAPQPGQCLVDGTLGGGGHARLLAEAVSPGGRVLALDRDPAAVEAARLDLAGLAIEPIHASYVDLPAVLAERQIEHVDGILLDLGLSSDQLADSDRGFSFSGTGDLDLRFDREDCQPAWELLRHIPEQKLADLIFQYGEERRSRRIAKAICQHRRQQPIRTAAELAEVVRRAIPPSADSRRIHPATRTFQALRIAVNDELGHLQQALEALPDCLAPGGRLAIISFHSLEDRPVKQAFRGDSRLSALTKKPVRPNQAELYRNRRSRSAKFRVAERNATEGGSQ